MRYMKVDIKNFTKEEITTFALEIGQPKYRAQQLWEWIWQKQAISFDEMTNLPAAFRERLNNDFNLITLFQDVVQYSDDGTFKVRFGLKDGSKIETVLIPVPEEGRFTVCVSCQVGCSLTCSFCATGKMKRIRNLEPAEIVDQVILVNQLCLEKFGSRITNIVYMGMGEPLLTYANVMRSIEMITSPDGLAMSPRRITVSTAGIAKMIKKLADDDAKINLALSLHAADDTKRNEIMPINEQNDLQTLMDAISYFYRKTHNRISYEYIALKGFNDTIEDAKRLIKLCHRFPVRVNVIEYNPIEEGGFEKSEEDTINQFARIVRESGVMITVRRSRGKDIDAACGQLANK